MKDINLFFLVSSIVREKSGSHCSRLVPLLFLTILFLTVCPLKGQTNNGIGAYLENDKIYLELDKSIIDKPILFVRHHMDQLHVKWSHIGNQVVLSQQMVTSVMGELIPIDGDYTIEERVLGKFPLITEKSKDDQLVIDATDLVLNLEIKWFRFYSPETIMRDLSFIKGVEFMDGETIIRTSQTLISRDSPRSISVDYSFYTLPEPMRGRLFDHRMGYMLDVNWSHRRNGNYKATIARWRLEKKYPEQKISEPIKPIIFYFDHAIPDKWKGYLRAGIMEWSPAFEAAGFKNAIEVKALPDSKSSENSVNYSLIRWVNYSGIRGAEKESGSSVHLITDQRSGEILKADILISSSLQSLSDEYLVRCAPLDLRTLHYPFSDDLVGELIQSVTAHEAGHAFGIMDANFGEYGYPVDKMGDVDWLREMGHTPSVMTYARHNYIAQPEDHVPPSLLVQKVGPMDIHHIKWGYTMLLSAKHLYDELPFLDAMIREKDSIAWFRFNSDNYGKIGPGNTNEVVDNNDPVRSTELGLKNIKKVLELLPALNRDKRDDDLLDRLYDKTLELWFDEMKHVTSLIGGVTIYNKAGFQKGDVFEPTPIDEQKRALKFLIENAFIVPDWLSSPSFENRLSYSTGSDILMIHQINLLSDVLNVQRMRRLEFMEKRPEYRNFIAPLLAELQAGLFHELHEKETQISKRRQELQLEYITLLINHLKSETNYDNIKVLQLGRSTSQSLKSAYAENLRDLAKQIQSALKKIEGGNNKEHLKICLMKIDPDL